MLCTEIALEDTTPTWKMYFDEACRMNEDGKEVSRVGIVLISHDNHMIPHAYILPEPCSNNVAEYRAIIIGMQVAQAVGAKSLEVYGDSQLVVNKMKDTFEVRKPNLIPHHAAAKKLVDGFQHFDIQLVFRMKNAKADALAGLAASLSIPEGESLTVTVCEK